MSPTFCPFLDSASTQRQSHHCQSVNHNNEFTKLGCTQAIVGAKFTCRRGSSCRHQCTPSTNLARGWWSCHLQRSSKTLGPMRCGGDQARREDPLRSKREAGNEGLRCGEGATSVSRNHQVSWLPGMRLLRRREGMPSDFMRAAQPQQPETNGQRLVGFGRCSPQTHWRTCAQ